MGTKKPLSKCLECGIEFQSYRKNAKYCSTACFGITRRKAYKEKLRTEVEAIQAQPEIQPPPNDAA